MDPEPEELSRDLAARAEDLNAAWARFEATLQGYRVAAQVPIEGLDTNLRWGRFGGNWALIIGDERGGQNVRHAPLATRIRAAVDAKRLREALESAEDGAKREILAAIILLDDATRVF